MTPDNIKQTGFSMVDMYTQLKRLGSPDVQTVCMLLTGCWC